MIKVKPRAPSSALLSSAFQQDLMQSLNVDMSMTGKPARRRRKKQLNRDGSRVARPELSLAQQMGLKPKPKAALSEREWDLRHDMSLKRSDYRLPCPICADVYKINDQVLLSCSHVFHSKCLASFERLSGREPTCPLCREKNYEKKRVHDSEPIYRANCATLIQKRWRGHQGRKVYAHMKRTIVPREPQQRQDFYFNKLSAANTQVRCPFMSCCFLSYIAKFMCAQLFIVSFLYHTRWLD
jgi:hypothetical protein